MREFRIDTTWEREYARQQHVPYTAQISRQNPGCFIFLIDQSLSMLDTLSNRPSDRKADRVADILNRFLQNLVIKSTKSAGVRHFFDVGVIGYGARVGPAFGGRLAGRELVPIHVIADNIIRIDYQTRTSDSNIWGGPASRLVKVPVWIDPVADGGTPMCAALQRCEPLVREWVAQHPRSYPPIIINITDSGFTDGDPTPFAQALTRLRTEDGNVLLFNCHITFESLKPVIFPNTDAMLEEEYARTLFHISSILPEPMRREARLQRVPVHDDSRGFAFNADLVSLIQFIDIGTSTPGTMED